MNTTPFLRSHGLLRLTDREHARRRLDPDTLRGLRHPDVTDNEISDGWTTLKRDDFLSGRVEGALLHRVCVTTDAGCGKTTNLEWLAAHFNHDQSQFLALKFEISKLPRWEGTARVDQLMLPLLVSECSRAPGLGNIDYDRLAKLLLHLRDTGRLVLLFDALDHVSEPRCVATLAALLRDANWDDCRIVVSGRPYSLVLHWDELFVQTRGPWSFVCIQEFTEPQIRVRLGKCDHGSDDRFDLIPEGARAILTVPRVLEMICELTDAELKDLKTASDVYVKACNRLVQKGLNAAKAARLGLSNDEPLPERPTAGQVQRAMLLLAAIAFEMTRRMVEAGGRDSATDFEHVPPGRREKFIDQVFDRIQEALPGRSRYDSGKDFDHDFNCLVAMNEFLEHGILDVDARKEIRWRNRSLREFFTADWMSHYCLERDRNVLWNCIYLPEVDETLAYREIWRFAVDMRDYSEEHWVPAVGVLYRRGDRLPEGEQPKRSCEMIYRSWGKMASGALGREVLRDFRNEGNSAAQELANEIVDLPGHWFEMGSPDGHGQPNEHPRHHVEVSEFGLSSFAVTNAQYELFDPSHRRRRWGSILYPYASQDQEPAKDTFPVVYVSWWDAAVFCKWLGKVQGRAFALPTEAQWEYACRAGTQTAYFYGPDLSSDQANNIHSRPGRTVAVDDTRFSPVVWRIDGEEHLLHHMHGNVYEWCWDWYSSDFYGTDAAQERDAVNTVEAADRVVRGGSWYDGAGGCRCAYRNDYDPVYRSHYISFRVALVRAEPAEQD